MSIDKICNIALIGHGSVGKTTLCEQILHRTGVVPHTHSVESGHTISDYTPEEITHKISIHTSVTSFQWNESRFNMLDTPGAADFVGEVIVALRVAEAGIMVINGSVGVQIETIKVWQRLNNRNMPRCVFVNKIDEKKTDIAKIIEDLQSHFDMPIIPCTIPISDGGNLICDFFDQRAYLQTEEAETAQDIPAELEARAAEGRTKMMECAAEGSDELVELFLQNETLNETQFLQGLQLAWRANKFVPVFFGSGETGTGIESMLNFLDRIALSPLGAVEQYIDAEGKENNITISDEGDCTALCFKTSIDQYVGKLSHIKVMTGTLSHDAEMTISRTRNKVRIHKLYRAIGKKLEPVNEIHAGDLGVVVKIEDFHTNDTICTPNHIIQYVPLRLPHPVHAVVPEPVDHKQEDKLNDLLYRIVEQDLTLHMEYDPETRQTVLAGMGEFHINIILDIVREHDIEVTTNIPKVGYRETITKRASTTYRHKKQSGGHGQFGEVSIEISPLKHGDIYAFENRIRGMAVSKSYIPGIEKGFHEAMAEGIVAGFPVVDVGIALTDGKEHPVDSSEMAFKIAAKEALRQAMREAGMLLLEPMMKLNILIEGQYLGDVLSDLSGKRGQVQGQEPKGDFILVHALVPHAELLRYTIDLRSITSGTGSFDMEFSHYTPIKGRIADEVIKATIGG